MQKKQKVSKKTGKEKENSTILFNSGQIPRKWCKNAGKIKNK